MDGFSFEPVPQSISTEMDSGPPKRRRRFSTAYGRYSMSFLLTGAQKADFDTFYGTTLAGGSGTITGFPDPVDKTTATFQFAAGGDPKWMPVRPDGSTSNRKWLLSVVWDRVA
jgi:hypothetical protein